MAEISIGSVFAGYRIEAVAGEGGMGRVYRATQMVLKRPVALKLIVPELAGDSDFRARFERESHLSASIDHPNVIPVYEAGEADGRLFIAMRWVEGTDLRSLIISEGRLDPARAVAIVSQIGEALDAAHSGGLVHRDVKPANVMLTSTHGREHAYLTDFGLTKRTASATALTRTGHFVGTPDYMPPEQIKGERADARADVYALGCLLFHALTGRPPYDRDNEVAKMYAQIHDPPPSAAEAAPGTPPDLDPVIARALAKDADQRYPSAGDLGRAARAALTGSDPSQPERSLATGLAAPQPPELAPTALAPGAAPTAPGTPRTAPDTPPTVPDTPATAPDTPAIAPDTPATAPDTPPTAPGAAPTSPAPVPGPTRSPPPAPPAASPAARPSERPRRRALPIIGGGVLVLGAVGGILAAAGIFSGDGENEAPQTRDGATSAAGDQPRDTQPRNTRPRAVATIPAGDGPDGIAVDGDVVWVSNSRGNTLTRLDPGSNQPIGDPVPVGRNPDEVEAADGVVWVANTDDGTVTRLEADPEPGASTIVRVGSGPEGLSLGNEFLWVANGDSDSVSRIDRASATTVGSPIPVGNKPIGIFAGKSSIWVTNSFAGTVTRIDPSTAVLNGPAIPVARNIRAVIERLGSTWVSSVDADTVTRLDPASGEVVGDPIKVGDRPKEMVAVNGFIWVVNEGSNSVSRIDPKAGKVVGRPIRVGRTPVGIAVGAGSLWVTNNASDTVTRIDPGRRSG
jgi:serine/threonine protein kinase/DNA-binding beta-propeller fold protein YncE